MRLVALSTAAALAAALSSSTSTRAMHTAGETRLSSACPAPVKSRNAAFRLQDPFPV